MIIIYGKASCKSCDEAKQLCVNKEVEHEYKQMGKDYTLTEFYNIAPRSVKSFPMISMQQGDGEIYIGGIQDLKDFLTTSPLLNK